MKFRKLVRAITEHQYQVLETTVSPVGLITSRELIISRSSTNLRRNAPCFEMEQFVGTEWCIIPGHEFNQIIKQTKPPLKIFNRTQNTINYKKVG